MTKQIINVGSEEQSGDGESIRSAFIKVNHNFDELYQVNVGAQGTQGIQGRQGLQGRQGTSGSQGLQGRQGISGSQGLQGIDGSQGIQGIAGSQGIQGIAGSQGIQGISGAELVVSASAPAVQYNKQWFNSAEGRLYINYNNTWLEASPTQLDPTAVRFDVDGNLIFPDESVAARFNAQESAPTIEKGALWFNSAEGRLYINYNNTWLEASPTQLDPTAVRFDSESNITFPDDSVAAKFDTNGNLTFPDSSVQSTAYRYAASTSAPIKTQGALWFNSVEGRLYINYNNNWIEASPTQVDASVLRADSNGVVEIPSGLSITSASNNSPYNGSFVIQDPGDILVMAATGEGGSATFGWTTGLFSPGSIASISFNEDNNGKTKITTGTYGSTLYNWVFSDNGDLLIPGGKDIKDATSGLSVLNTATTGNITFSGSTASSSTNSNIVLSTNSKNFTFGADGSTTFPNGAKLSNGTNYQFATDNSIVTSLDLRDTTGRGFYTDSEGYTLRSNGTYNWVFKNTGILTLPYQNYMETTDTNLKVGSQGKVVIRANAATSPGTKTWTFETSGKLTIPGEIASAAGTGSVVINSNDGTNTHTWTFGTDASATVPGPIVAKTNPATGGMAVADEPASGYGGTLAIFVNGDYSVGNTSTVQPGWTVTDGLGFSDTILSVGDPFGGSIKTTSVNWPTGGGRTYTFTSPDYAVESYDSVVLTSHLKSWIFAPSGDLTLPSGGKVSYTPGTSSSWSGTPPTTIEEAIDRLAALLKTLNSGTGA